jgi:hypothetical protein
VTLLISDQVIRLPLSFLVMLRQHLRRLVSLLLSLLIIDFLIVPLDCRRYDRRLGGRKGLVDQRWLSAVEELSLHDTPSWAPAPLPVTWLSFISFIRSVGEHCNIISASSLLLQAFVQPTTLDKRWSVVF